MTMGAGKVADIGSSVAGRSLLPLVERISTALDSIVTDFDQPQPSTVLSAARDPAAGVDETRRLILELSVAVAEILALLARRGPSGGEPQTRTHHDDCALAARPSNASR